MSSGISAHLAALEAIFDPFMPGTTAAPNTEISGGGAELSTLFAKLSYGSSAAATGISAPLGDLNLYYAAIGTATYGTPLPINGASYAAGASTTGASVTALLEFQIYTGGWQVSKTISGVSTVLASGTLPTGAVSCQYTDTWQNASGDTGAGTVVNQMASYTAITGTYQSISVALSVAGGGGTKQSTHTVVINLKNSAGAVISTTTITFVVGVDGE